MNKYVVKVVHVFSNLVEVEAESEDQARKVAMDTIENGNQDFKNYYESTLPPENWAVISQEDFDKIKAEVAEKIKAADANKQEASSIIEP